jgi:flagellin
MTSINTNTASTIAANALYKNERKMGVAMERLSTGLRINSAKDDAAGLAIAKKMSAQISGLRQASRNANDGIAMLQTFEGASGEITSMLNRMRDLMIQSANGTYTTADRANLGEEYDSLLSEINRTINDTQWNTRNLMKGDGSGTGNTVSLMIGANAGQTMDVVINDWSSQATTKLTVAPQVDGGAAPEDTDVTLVNVKAGDTVVFIIDNKEYSYAVTADRTATQIAGDLATWVQTNLPGGPSQSTNGGGSTLSIIQTAGDNTNYADITGAFIKHSKGVIVDSWSTTTASGAVGLRDIDNAITNATSERSKYGAYISRLEKTSDNLLNVALNTDASRGQIEDADYAAETTELARTQIIAQAGTAMLAQANQVKQTVLALLK